VRGERTRVTVPSFSLGEQESPKSGALVRKEGSKEGEITQKRRARTATMMYHLALGKLSSRRSLGVKRRHEMWIYDAKLSSRVDKFPRESDGCQRSLVNYPTRFRRYTSRWFNKRRAWRSSAISGRSRSRIISTSNDSIFFPRETSAFWANGFSTTWTTDLFYRKARINMWFALLKF